MDALWAEAPLSADEIVRRVGPAQGWGDATVKTLINRLLKKKALASFRDQGRTVYRPLLSQADFITGESQGFLDRLFGGKLSPLVAHLAKSKSLTPDEIAQLKRLIAELDEED